MQENQVPANPSEIAANTAKQENTSQDSLDQYYPCVRAKLQIFSAEQLNMYIHEVKWLLKELEKVVPGSQAPYLEIGKHSMIVEEQVIFMQEALILERARRQSLHLQALLTSEETPDESNAAL